MANALVEGLDYQTVKSDSLIREQGGGRRRTDVSMVRNYANRTGIQESQAFFHLYSHFTAQAHYNPSVQAKKHGLRPIEYIEKKGDMDVLYNCAHKLLK